MSGATYSDLYLPGVPLMVREAVALLGTREAVGAANNPIILGWWDALRNAGKASRAYGDFYRADSIPWCGLFIAWVAYRANPEGRADRDPPPMFLSALEWTDWGRPVKDAPALGDVLTFRRPGGGHVGLYVGEDAAAFHVLGGNQGDSVSIIRIDRRPYGTPGGRFVEARRPCYRKRPASAVPIRRAASGRLSRNEA